MAHHNGGGDAFVTAEAVAVDSHARSSVDGFGGSAADDQFAERPELLLGAALLGGLLLAGLVSRLGR
jgi:hypothetical protein